MANKKKTTSTRKNPYAFKSKKMEAQYQELRSRFYVSRKEFETYYQNIRKANKKGQNMKRYDNALYRPHYSTEVGGIRTRQEFTARQKSLNIVLTKTYREVRNQELRNRFYANLSYAYGKDADAVISAFMTLSDGQVLDFLRRNKDLEIVYYDSDAQSVAAYLATIGMTVDKFIGRI